MKYLTTLFLVLFSFQLSAQNWVSQEPLPFNTVQVQSLEVNSDRYSVIAIDANDSLRYRTDFDPTTGDILTVEQIETHCAPIASRVATQEYLQATPDATGFTVTRLRYDENCQATELYNVRFDLGPVGNEVLLGEGMYSVALDAYFIFGIKVHGAPSSTTPYQQFLYQIDPEDGMLQQVRVQQDTSYSTPPEPVRIESIVPNLGIFTQMYDQDYGILDFTSFDASISPFDNIAQSECTGMIVKVCANESGDIAFLDYFCIRGHGGNGLKKVSSNGVENYAYPDFMRALHEFTAVSYTDLDLDENGDVLASARLSRYQNAEGVPGTVLFRIDPQGDSLIYRFFPGEVDESPTFSKISTTPNKGLFAAGVLNDDLFVLKIDAQVVGLFDQPSTLGLTIYPNPATDLISFSAREVLAQAEPYAIYDLSGRLVNFGTLNKDASIDATDLPAGQYAVTLPRINAVGKVFVR